MKRIKNKIVQLDSWIIRLAFLALTYTLVFSSSPSAFALTVPKPPIQSIPTTVTGVSDVSALICGILLWIFWGLIVLSIVMFLVGGYRYVTSGGDSEKVSSANKTLLYAAIAVAVGLVAAGVPLIVSSLLGGTANLGNSCSGSGGGGGGVFGGS